MTENPYASPTIVADVVAEAPIEELKLASQGKRFLNFVIDSIVLQILVQGTAFIVGVAYGIWLLASQQPITLADDTRMQVVGWLLGFSIYLIYFVTCEFYFQRTLAKLLTGTRVVAATRARPTLGQIVGRSFARFIPFEAFSFLGSERPVGLHDSLSGTRVVTIR